MDRQRGVRDPLRTEMDEWIERGRLEWKGTTTTTRISARMATPTSTPRESSSMVVRSLLQKQDYLANEDPHGQAHNRDPDIDNHGGSHGLAGDGLAH